MPKRARSESTASVDTQPAPARREDPELEAQLAAVDIDEDFKESIRAMTPNTRREVMNDIVRGQQAAAAPPPGARAVPIQALLQGLFAPPEEAEAEARGGRRGPQAAEDGSDDDEIGLHPLQVLMGLLMQRQQQPRVPGEEDQLGRLMMALTNLNSQAQQYRVMQEMGISEEDMDNMSYEDLLALEERIGSISKGLRPEVIPSTFAAPAPGGPREDRCAICQDEWAAAETAAAAAGAHRCVALKCCGHEFHADCVSTWLASNKTCPICKREVI